MPALAPALRTVFLAKTVAGAGIGRAGELVFPGGDATAEAAGDPRAALPAGPALRLRQAALHPARIPRAVRPPAWDRAGAPAVAGRPGDLSCPRRRLVVEPLADPREDGGAAGRHDRPAGRGDRGRRAGRARAAHGRAANADRAPPRAGIGGHDCRRCGHAAIGPAGVGFGALRAGAGPVGPRPAGARCRPRHRRVGCPACHVRRPLRRCGAVLRPGGRAEAGRSAAAVPMGGGPHAGRPI